MVTTTEVGQLAEECTLWMDILRAFRFKFQNQRSILPHLAAGRLGPEVLMEIEHLDNQLHIQLINIHDLKQQIKKHLRTVGPGRTMPGNHISDEVLARHEYLFEEFQNLESTLHVIAGEFDDFAKYAGGRRG